MKKKCIRILCVLLACGLTAAALGFLQALVQPKYMSQNREGALISEYYAEDGVTHDVLFIGDCEVYEGFTPPTLWEEYGITSYIRGSAQQLAWHSYYLLEEMLRIETPRVVVYNVLALKYGTPQNEAYNRIALDGMKLSLTKLAAAKASMTDGESLLSYIFPILRYHSRWKELASEDFTYLFSRKTVSHNGYLMQNGIKPGFEDIPPSPLTDYTLPESSMQYLDAMRELCEARGVEFVLIKAPTNNWKYHWYDEWDAQIVAYAAEYGLHYYNFIPEAEAIGIDWSTDTYDGGTHLNVFGAEKLTSYFGAILADEFGLTGHRGEAEAEAIWSEKLDAYKLERDAK